MSCPDNNSNYTDPVGCGNLPDVYECPDDGTYLYNIAKRLRWFGRAEITGTCPANYVGDSVVGRGSYTSRISQADANTQATAIANTAIAAALNCQPLFWTGSATYVWQCTNPAVSFSVTMTTPSFVSQEHADLKAYALAYETAKGMGDAFCCASASFSYTATYTATCTTGPSNPFATSVAVVTAMSCTSALEAQSIAENEASRAAQLGLSCTYATDQNLRFLTGTQQCSEGNSQAYQLALTGAICPPDVNDPCKCGSGAYTNEPTPADPSEFPCQQACWLRQCGVVVGVTLFNCDESPPAGATMLTTKKVSFQVCNVINGQTVCETVTRVMYIWVLDLPEPTPGCEPCGSGYGMESFLFACVDGNPDCNVLGFYCCGSDPAGFGFCTCYAPCCLGAAFCVDY